MASRQNVRIVGAPMDLGAGRRGVDMGPSAIRLAGLARRLERLGYTVSDAGDVLVPSPETVGIGNDRARYLEPIRDVCDSIRTQVRTALEQDCVPLVLGGDHSIAIGTVSGIAEHYRARSEKIGVIWFDAHADMNTPDSSPSGNIHGMPLSALLGMGHPDLVGLGGFEPKMDRTNTCLVGIRNLDESEKAIVRESGVHAFTMREIDERGMLDVVREAIEHASHGTAGFHLSFDIDGMDPTAAPGVGTPVKGGVNWREAQLFAETVFDSGNMVSMEVTEVNPILDVRNQSGEVAVDVIASAFGNRIL